MSVADLAPNTLTIEEDMPYLVGFLVALAVCFFGILSCFDCDRSFYPTLLVVVASYYVLFAVMGGSTDAIVTESIGAIVFLVAAILGHRKSDWIVASGLAAHGVFDAVHGQLISNPGVPPWWPAFCLAFDLSVAVFLFRRSLVIRTFGRTGLSVPHDSEAGHIRRDQRHRASR
ncbi:MAG: hypothetical protein ABI877_13380 [Gemmatimonadaceae bacterium]